MSKFAGWIGCLLFAAVPLGALHAAQVQLAPGNGIWLKPASTAVIGNEAAVVSLLHARAIQHVFLWTTTNTAGSYPIFIPFIQQAHARGMTVHAVCATKASVTDGDSLSSVLLSNDLNEVVAYNASHPEAAFDGVQIDVEGVTGDALLNLVQGVSVPETLVFSADVQPNEYYTGVESYYHSLLQDTDLDLLIPMIYIMDGLGYRSGTNRYTFTVPGIAAKTDQLLALLPSQGRMMTGLSGYDMQFGVVKGGGVDTSLSCHGASNMAMGGGNCAVPHLLGLYPLADVVYQSNGGVSVYRFNVDADSWLDVMEMTPSGLRRSMGAADQAGAGDSRYVGTCTWLYHTTFDSSSGRQEAFMPDDGVYPSPSVRLEVLGVSGGEARLRVTLTNANPSERVLGAHAAAGVHIQLEGGAFSSADPGGFHAAEGFDATGGVLPSVAGAQVIELRRSFFESPAAQQARSGEIVVRAPALLTVRYRAWMMDKDSICNDVGTSEPYVARSPDDVHYHDDSKFLSYATYATNIVVSQPGSYAAAVLAHNPAGYWRFDDGLNPPKAANSGSLGSAADGAYLDWSTTIADLRPPAWPGLETTNRVLQLFGTNGQVLIPPLNLNTNTVTFECLIQRNGSQQNFAGLIMHRNADGGGASACGLGFRGPYSHLGYNWNDAANTYTWDSGLTPPDGHWAYVALAVGPSQAMICLCDGTTWSTATRSVSHAAQAFAGLTRVGTDGGTNRWFNGLIDEAAIYSVTLSAAQLRTHALAALGNTNQPLFTQVPLSQTVELGATAVFAAATVGTPTIGYQWEKDGEPLPDETNLSLSLSNVDYTHAGQYRLGATNSYGGVLSPAATLTVRPPSSVTDLTYRMAGTPSAPSVGLIWPEGALFSAEDLTGPWTIVSNAWAPYCEIPITPETPRRFFRVAVWGVAPTAAD